MDWRRVVLLLIDHLLGGCIVCLHLHGHVLVDSILSLWLSVVDLYVACLIGQTALVRMVSACSVRWLRIFRQLLLGKVQVAVHVLVVRVADVAWRWYLGAEHLDLTWITKSIIMSLSALSLSILSLLRLSLVEWALWTLESVGYKTVLEVLILVHQLMLRPHALHMIVLEVLLLLFVSAHLSFPIL